MTTGVENQNDAAHEFRCHSGRARYLMRDRNPSTLGLLGGPHEGVWTDYAGDTVYGDYRLELDETVLTPARHADHMPGSYVTTTQPAVYPATQPTESTEWYHTDQVGTTRAMTGEPAGEPPAPGVMRRAVYTAFGELVTETGSDGTRYGYCGAWGYESDWPGDRHAAELWGEGFDSPCGEFGGDAAGLVHVGARWYEPATGRFIQRDPIGIRGGLNVYKYVDGNPLDQVDPDGNISWKTVVKIAGGGAVVGGAAKFIGKLLYDDAQKAGEKAAKQIGLEQTVWNCANGLAQDGNLLQGKWYQVPPDQRSKRFQYISFMLLDDGRVSVLGETSSGVFQIYLKDKWGEKGIDARPPTLIP